VCQRRRRSISGWGDAIRWDVVSRVNSRYLLKDGRPWLPVMGEFHFSRYPAELWEEELLKVNYSPLKRGACPWRCVALRHGGRIRDVRAVDNAPAANIHSRDVVG